MQVAQLQRPAQGEYEWYIGIGSGNGLRGGGARVRRLGQGEGVAWYSTAVATPGVSVALQGDE